MKTFSGQGNNVTYTYNGLGDRLRETVNGNPTTFTMDLNVGLTQALSDGTKAYIYGNGRIAQATGTNTEYFLGDALGSVRQLTNVSGAITYAKAYDPYGVVTSTSGGSSTAYGYTSEYTSQGLVYLRARHYAPGIGRFLTRDTWAGIYSDPITLNRWAYVRDNPVLLTDPSGNDPITLIILAVIGLGVIAGISGCNSPYVEQIIPTPTLVPPEVRVKEIEALAIKYGITLPVGVGWGYYDESDYKGTPLDIVLGRNPFKDELEPYSTGERETLYDNKVYLTNWAFEESEIQLVGGMIHEARHAYQEQSEEDLGNPLKFPEDATQHKALFEADAYTIEKIWLERHGETLHYYHQDLLDQYRREMPSEFTLPLPLPVPFK